MIIELSLGLAGKIPYLTVEKIKIPCSCKVLKIIKDREDADILVDLCQIHTEKYKRMEDSKEDGVLIPGMEIESQ